MATKPNKPWADYPLYAHNAGVWAKKIRGKTHYFGPWSDPQAALETYLEQRDFLLAGNWVQSFHLSELASKKIRLAWSIFSEFVSQPVAFGRFQLVRVSHISSRVDQPT